MDKTEMNIASAKVRVPLVATDVAGRPRLQSKLSQGVQTHSVTLVQAPAGYGKTSLVAQWAARTGMPCAWLSIGPEDGGIERFWNYVLAALCQVDVSPAASIEPMRGVLTPESGVEFVDRLLACFDGVAQPFALVLDDLHNLPADAGCLASLGYFVTNLPPTLRLVINTRCRPPAFLNRMRLDGRVAAIGQHDLALTPKETAVFLERKGMALPPDGVQELCRAVEGWPVAVKLAALSKDPQDARGSADWDAALRGATADYLFDEVIERLPGQIRDVATVLACVDSFTPSLAAAIVGGDAVDDECEAAVARALQHLIERDLFVTETTSRQGESWYTFHALFRDALRLRLSRQGAARTSRALLAASLWYERCGMLDSAVQAAARANEPDRVADLVFDHAYQLYRADEMPQLLSWYDYLPDAYVDSHPRLLLEKMLPCATAGRVAEADACAAAVARSLKNGDDWMAARYEAYLALVRAVEGRAEEALAAAQKALGLLPESEYFLRSMCLQAIGGTSNDNDPVAARSAFLEALHEVEGRRDPALLCSLYANLAVIEQRLGNVGAALAYVQKAKGLFEGDRWKAQPMVVVAVEAEFACHALRGDDARCGELFAFIEDHGAGLHMPQQYACVVATRARQLHGRADAGSFGDIAALNAAGVAQSYPSIAWLATWDEGSVRNLARALADTDSDNPCVVRLTLALEAADARAELRRDEAGARARLERVAARALAQLGRLNEEGVLDRIEMLVLRAVALALVDTAGEHAVEALEEACLLAQPEDIRMPIIEESELLADTLALCARRNPAGYAATLHRELPNPYDRADRPRGGEMAAALSEREIDVLRLAAAGMTTAAIAERLFISRETAKKHLANSYAKLGVHTRMQAVSLARELGLVK